MSSAHRRPFLEDDLYGMDDTPTEPCSSPMVEAALRLSAQLHDDDRDDEPATRPPPRAAFATLPMIESADLAQRRPPLDDAFAQTLAATPEANPLLGAGYAYAPVQAPPTPPPFLPSSPRKQAFTGSVVLPPSSVRRAFIAALQPEPAKPSFPRWIIIMIAALVSIGVIVALGEVVMRALGPP